MKLLLDTHAVIWYITGDKKLPALLRGQIEDSSNSCFVSIASLWEMAIKHASGKLALHADIDVVFEIIKMSGIQLLPVTIEHVLWSATLPLHHNDPFDRMIISQCLEENFAVVSCDRQFRHYDVPVIWNRSLDE